MFSSMAGWQPMETAPRDETEILLLTTVGITSARFYAGEWHRSFDGDEYEGPVWSCCDDMWQIEVEESPVDNDNTFQYNDGEATHWMYLPELPK